MPNKTNIEWVVNPDRSKGLSWNPVKGLCPGVYPECATYCYARKDYKRWKWNPKIRLDEKELNCRFPKKPSRIFVGSTFDLSFADKDWLLQIRKKVLDNPRHTFIFLTKNPVLYEVFQWPINCWLGMTVFGVSGLNNPLETKRFQDFKKMDNYSMTSPYLKFVSFEPLLKDALGDEDLKGISWVIIGAQTKPNIQPDIRWIERIVNQANKDNCKIFMKSNLDRMVKVGQIPESGKA